MMFQRLFGRRWLMLAIYAVAVPLSAWLCTRIRLDSNLLNLLPEDIPAAQTVRKLEKWAGGSAMQFMYLGLVRDDRTSLPDLKRLADEMGVELNKSRWVQPVSVGVDITAIKKAAPLFLEPEDLETLGTRLEEKVKSLRKQRSGFFLDLEDEKPAELKLDDIFPKIQRRFQWEAQAGQSGKDGPSALLSRLRARTNPDATLLYYLSPDEKMLTFFFNPVFPPDELAHYPELIVDVDKAIAAAMATVPAAATVQIYKGGAHALQWDQRDTTLKDARRSAFWAGLIILFIDLLTVRRPRSTVMVYLSLTVGLVITFALSYLVIGTVSVITAFLLAILAGLGVDFGYYFSTRYNLFVAAGLDRDAAVREAWTQTAVPAAMGALTTMAVMVIVAFGRFRGFSELGIICSIGIVAIYVAMYTLCPALFLRFAKGGRGDVGVDEARRRVGRIDNEGAAAPSRFARFNPAGKAAPAVLAVAALATVGFALSARSVRFAYTGEELTVRGQVSLEIDKMILAHYGENVDQTVVLTESEAKARRIQAYFEDNFGKFKSIARYESAFTFAPPLDRQQAALERMGPLRRALEKLPKRDPDPDVQFALSQGPKLIDPEPMTVDKLPAYLKGIHIARDREGRTLGYVGHIVAKRWLWDIDELTRFVNEVEALRVDGEPLETTGRAQIFMRVIQIVQHEAGLFSIIGAVIILAMFWIQARNLKFALLCMLPLFFGIVWTLGCLPHVGEKGIYLSFMNLVVLPILVGLGVAFGVHVVYNYRLYGSAERSLRVTLRPVMGSSASALVGWASLLLASMIGMQGIGWLATIGMFWVTIVSIVVLPALIAVLDRAGLIKPDRMPAPDAHAIDSAA